MDKPENSFLCLMQPLSFPPYDFRLEQVDGKTMVFCQTRKKMVLLTPEEWVRQHTVRFLIQHAGYPATLLNVEKSLKVNGLSKRYDVVVYRPEGSVFLLVECKAPQVSITQGVFDQIARYNLSLDARFLMVTNGISHYFCRLDYQKKRYEFLPQLPSFSSSEP